MYVMLKNSFGEKMFERPKKRGKKQNAKLPPNRVKLNSEAPMRYNCDIKLSNICYVNN